MREFEIELVRKADPMMVVKKQGALEERMDPGFWSPVWYETLIPLLRAPGLHYVKDLVQDGKVIASDHVRASRGEHKGPAYSCGYYTVNGFLPTGYATYALERCDDRAFHRLRRSQVREGDILVAGSGKGSVGKVCLIDQVQMPAVVGDLYILRAKRDLVFPECLTLFLKSRYGQAQIFRHETGVSGQTHIDKEELERFLVPALPMDVQQRAAEEFSRMLTHHYLAMDAASNRDKAQEHQNRVAEERYHAEYEHNLTIAEAMLNDLVRQVEEIIEGTRTEIESVDRVLNKEQASGA
jgi:hypothetical protein